MFVHPTIAMDPNASTSHSPSLRAMLETSMMTQVAHGQLIVKLLNKVAALRVDFAEHRSSFPSPLPSSSS